MGVGAMRAVVMLQLLFAVTGGAAESVTLTVKLLRPAVAGVQRLLR